MWYYALPAVFCTLTNILMNLVSQNQLTARASVFDEGEGSISELVILNISLHFFPSAGGNRKAVVWFMVMLAGSICCIGGAIWILAEHYGVGSTGTEWPGVSLLLQTVFVTISGLLFFFGRPKGYTGIN